MNKQIKDELDVFSKESVLSEAKRIKGLRAVFGEVSCPPVLLQIAMRFWFCFCELLKHFPFYFKVYPDPVRVVSLYICKRKQI